MRGDNQTNKRTDERKSPCVLQDFVPFGAAAQKTANFQSEMKKISSIWCLRNDEPLEFMSKKMSLDESGRRQNPIYM